MAKRKKEHIATIHPDRDIKPRVNLNNRTIAHTHKKKAKEKLACRKNKKGKL